MNKKCIKVVELFAGVGGFRVGLESAKNLLKTENSFEVVWSNQWEPGESKQYASKVYASRWPGSNHSNEDISTVKKIPVNADLLVGGFPCQDYSVAKSLSQSHGISGKKGVLWWEIHRLISSSNIPTILLENVDRLLNSPAKQKGRDFALMLASLNDLGYIVEWRVINAADYGHPQKRKRIFIFAYKKNSAIKKEISNNTLNWLTEKCVFAQAFPVQNLIDEKSLRNSSFDISGDLVEITNNFNHSHCHKNLFSNTGIAIDRKIVTIKTTPSFKGKPKVLRNIIIETSKVPEEYFIPKSEIKKWAALKNAKTIPRTSKSGTSYMYTEGKMSFPDSLDKPARTIVTGEGGKSPSRFKHVIQLEDGRYRRLMPEELEKLNGFKPGHTNLPEISNTKRAFFMGNALITDLIKDFALKLHANKHQFFKNL